MGVGSQAPRISCNSLHEILLHCTSPSQPRSTASGVNKVTKHPTVNLVELSALSFSHSRASPPDTKVAWHLCRCIRKLCTTLETIITAQRAFRPRLLPWISGWNTAYVEVNSLLPGASTPLRNRTHFIRARIR